MVLNSFRSTHLLPILTKLLKMRQEILPHPVQSVPAQSVPRALRIEDHFVFLIQCAMR